jgi:hypothetical protein
MILSHIQHFVSLFILSVNELIDTSSEELAFTNQRNKTKGWETIQSMEGKGESGKPIVDFIGHHIICTNRNDYCNCSDSTFDDCKCGHTKSGRQ